MIANTHDMAEEGQIGGELGPKGAAGSIVVEAPMLTKERSGDVGKPSGQADMVVVGENPPTKKVAKEEQNLTALVSGWGSVHIPNDG